jgi:hypothetical protein
VKHIDIAFQNFLRSLVGAIDDATYLIINFLARSARKCRIARTRDSVFVFGPSMLDR